MIVIGLQKPYSKSDSVQILYCSMIFIYLLVDDGYFLAGSKYMEYISNIRITHNDTDNWKKLITNNWTNISKCQ